jgi:hypothetical protein
VIFGATDRVEVEQMVAVDIEIILVLVDQSKRRQSFKTPRAASEAQEISQLGAVIAVQGPHVMCANV